MHRIELHGSNTASFGGITHKSNWRTGPIGPLARKMLDTGAAKPFDKVEVYRNGTLCFHARDLIHWATVHSTESDAASVKTVVYKPRPELAGA